MQIVCLECCQIVFHKQLADITRPTMASRLSVCLSVAETDADAKHLHCTHGITTHSVEFNATLPRNAADYLQASAVKRW